MSVLYPVPAHSPESPKQAPHIFQGATPLGTTVAVGAVTHSYVAQVPQVQARVAPGAVTHSYTAQVPKVNARVAPSAVTHVYAVQVPSFGLGAVIPILVQSPYQPTGWSE